MTPDFSDASLGHFITISICLFLSAFFSASETAITSLGILKARHMVESNEKGTSQLKLWLNHPDRVLTTILIFNNVVNILASAIATQMATAYFKNSAIGIATGIMTFLILIFGEIIPKSFARANSEKLAVFFMRVIQVLHWVAFPFVWGLATFAQFIIKRLGSDHKIKPSITEEELEFLIDVGESSGVLEELKKDMISGVFDFDEIKVRAIMTPRTDIVAIAVDEEITNAIQIAIQTGYSRIPVYEEKIDNITGIIFAKDLLRHLSDGELKPGRITDVMREPYFTPESKSIMEVFKDLKRTKNHIAVVIDEYGGTAGIVTMEDILEEIVGEIQDEFDAEEAPILEIDSQTFDVSGSVTIPEFIDYFDLNDEFEKDMEGGVDTIGGWVTHHLGDMPKVGQAVNHGDLSLEVAEVDRHRIERIKVTKNSLLGAGGPG